MSENAVGATSDTYRPGDDAGKMASTDDRFESERERAIEDLEREDVLSFYVGTLLDEGGTQAIEYRLRIDSEGSSTQFAPSVTNVSSILAYTGAPIECHYAASKAGLLGLTKSHARDFAPEIRVNAIAPGHVETDMTADRTPAEADEERAAIPLGRFGRPAEIADAAAYLRDATFVTGETLNVNGGELMR